MKAHSFTPRSVAAAYFSDERAKSAINSSMSAENIPFLYLDRYFITVKYIARV